MREFISLDWFSFSVCVIFPFFCCAFALATAMCHAGAIADDHTEECFERINQTTESWFVDVSFSNSQQNQRSEDAGVIADENAVGADR
jgi:hypothetical protein